MLPSFEYRLLILLGLFFLILFMWLIRPGVKKKREKRRSKRNERRKNKKPGLFMKIGFWIRKSFISKLFYKFKRKEDNSDSTKEKLAPSSQFGLASDVEVKEKKNKLQKVIRIMKIINYSIFLLAFVIGLFGLVIVSICARPYASLSVNKDGKYLVSAEEPIELTFDIPVEKESLELNISPTVKGEWKFEGFIGEQEFSPFTEKAVFYPNESFFPGDKVVIYVVGLKRIMPGGNKHEQALETFAPKVPEITEMNPSDGTENYKINQNTEISFDGLLGKFVEFKYESEPPFKFTIEEGEDKKSTILVLDENLNQDTEYKLRVYRTLGSYEVDSGDDIRVSETELIKEIKFLTVKTPSIGEVSLKGESARPDLPLVVKFQEPMDKESVENSFTITPELSGTKGWEDDKSFKFEPDESFQKDTEYTVLFKQGVLTVYGGETPEDITLKFKTLGKVQVNSFSPVNGSKNLNPNSTNIVIGFNQEVDHNSAQEHVKISPNPGGGYSWDGNKMIISTAGKLSYNTRYSVTVDPGVKSVYGLDSDKKFLYAFSTRQRTLILSVPQYYQAESFTCNIAAARMALAYKGVHKSENQIRNGVGIGTDPNQDWVSGYGVHADPVAAYIRNYRNASVKRGWNTPDLAREVEKGNPVILWWYNRYSQPKGSFTLSSGATGYKGMHSEVVVGFVGDSSNPTSLIVNDSWRGRLYYSRSSFDSNWAYMNRTAIVVY